MRRLAGLFRSHPIWRDAARSIAAEATDGVWFRHRPGEPWHLEHGAGGSLLRPGPSRDPDFCFCFTAASIERLAAVRGGIGDFAVTLFELILSEDPELRVGFRIVAPFERLARRGYLALLLRAGPRLLWFGARHGVASVPALRRLVEDLLRRGPEPWETENPAPRS